MIKWILRVQISVQKVECGAGGMVGGRGGRVRASVAGPLGSTPSLMTYDHLKLQVKGTWRHLVATAGTHVVQIWRQNSQVIKKYWQILYKKEGWPGDNRTEERAPQKCWQRYEESVWRAVLLSCIRYLYWRHWPLTYNNILQKEQTPLFVLTTSLLCSNSNETQ